MAYSSEIYSLADNKLYLKRLKAVEELKNKKQFFYKRFPRAEVIERELAKTAVRAAKSVISGSDIRAEILNLKSKNMSLKYELERMLEEAGLRSDYLEIKYCCEKCSDEGYIDGIMCRCLKYMIKRESYEKLNRTSPLSLSTFEGFSLDFYSDIGENSDRKIMSNILKICKNYADMFTKNSVGLLMEGGSGVGKTHLSLAVANEIIKKGFNVIYNPAQSIVSVLEKEKFQNSNPEESSERHFISCDLLIIDDLGTEFSTNFSNAAIYNIINSRILMQKPTIISTNLSAKELEKSYSERIKSRLFGNHINLEFAGEDIRHKKFKNRK